MPFGTYQVCSHCVMDTSDPDIVFDEEGTCNHCHSWKEQARLLMYDAKRGQEVLEQHVTAMQVEGRGKDYDCIIGVSGGVDSTYVAYVVKAQLGLRPLAVHLDNGWNSTLAVSNIQRTLERLDIELETEVLDWEEFRDLQLAFLKSSTPDSEIPTDHAIQAVLMAAARRHGIRYVIGGSNLATEGVLPRAWSHGIRDWKYIRSVHQMFGSGPLRSFPHFSMVDFARFWTLERRQRLDVLNLLPYQRAEAMAIIRNELGWEYYGGKHYESVYTRFFQAYILPRKFGFDKRRAHLATLINARQLSRDEALEALLEPICEPALLRQDKEFVIKKLGLTTVEFEEIMALPPKSFADYPSYEREWWYRPLRQVFRAPRTLRGWVR